VFLIFWELMEDIFLDVLVCFGTDREVSLIASGRQ
jgi:hypothetical protein